MDLQKVKAINESHWKVFLAIAGGGQTFLGDYLSISGASKTIVGALVPYSSAVFDKFIRYAKVDSYASSDAARKLAVASYNECIEAKVERVDALGIGVSCSLVKDEERLGRQHRIHIALHTSFETRVFNVYLNQGRTRQDEEYLAKSYIFQMLD